MPLSAVIHGLSQDAERMFVMSSLTQCTSRIAAGASCWNQSGLRSDPADRSICCSKLLGVVHVVQFRGLLLGLGPGHSCLRRHKYSRVR